MVLFFSLLKAYLSLFVDGIIAKYKASRKL